MTELTDETDATGGHDAPALQAHRELPLGVHAVATARRFVETHLATWRGSPEMVSTASLVVSELVTNAVLYGYGLATLHLVRDGDGLIIEVADHSAALPAPRIAHDESEIGRGLHIIEAVSTAWGGPARDRRRWQGGLVPPRLDLTTAVPTLFDGPVGLWTGALDALAPSRVREVVAELDEEGWGGLWFGEAYGREAFTNAAMLLGASSRLPVATGIANIYARDAMAMAGAAKTVASQFPGRFVCGMGVSHAPLVERMRGHEYAGPVSTMRAYLEAMATAPFAAVGPEDGPPLVLAALGPKMIELARERTAGVHPYLITPEWTATTRELVGPAAEVAVMQAVVLDEAEDAWRERAHWYLEIYTGLPNYRNSWLRQGFEESDLGRGGSERLKQAMVPRGEAAIEASVRAHLDAGASHVCLQVLGPDAGTAPVEDWRRLAAALL